MISLSHDKSLTFWDIPGFSKLYHITNSLLAFPELSGIVKDFDEFEIIKDKCTYILIHKSQIYSEIRPIMAFDESIEKYSQKDLHYYFYNLLIEAWSEYLI